jgi:hypothetical protein
MSTALDLFVAQTSVLAQKLGLKDVVIAVRDPKTAECRVVASPGALTGLRDPVAAKFGFADDGEDITGWPSQ